MLSSEPAGWVCRPLEPLGAGSFLQKRAFNWPADFRDSLNRG
jgi:hypothetical protein